MNVTDRQTDRQTDHATRSVAVGRVYVRSTAMRLNNNSYNVFTEFMEVIIRTITKFVTVSTRSLRVLIASVVL